LRSFAVFSITPHWTHSQCKSRRSGEMRSYIYDCMTVMTQKLVISMKHRSHHLTLS